MSTDLDQLRAMRDAFKVMEMVQDEMFESADEAHDSFIAFLSPSETSIGYMDRFERTWNELKKERMNDESD